MNPHFRTLITAFLAVIALASCDNGPRREVLSGATMGTTWSVIYRRSSANDSSTEPNVLQPLIDAELKAINQALSTYISDSEISTLNELEGDVQVELSPGFSKVLSAALAVGEITDGAYDVTVGPLVELWGFGVKTRPPEPPEDVDIAAAMELVGAHRLNWNEDALTLARPDGLKVDLSSIAKGYAVDRLSELLRARGVEDSLVEIGGELRASGERPEGGPWRLAVESPEQSKSRFIEALIVNDAAVATSGDYRNYFEFQGRRYSHLVDPRTGYPVAHDLVSVTVIDSQCMVADALATALLVLGLESALEVAERQGIAAHFVSRGEGGLEVHYTQPFNAFRQNTQPEGAPVKG